MAKVTFGAEPKDCEVYAFVLHHYDALRFSPSVSETVSEKPRNPKRAQRELKKQCSNIGVGTKSQQALKLQQEQMKTERKQHSRELKEAESQHQYALRQKKKKEKHRGR